MKQKISLLIITVLTGWFVVAQKTTNSPYSYYGIGEVNFAGSAEERAMGGIGVYADSIRINNQNPATLSQLQYTAYMAGFSLKSRVIRSSASRAYSTASSVDYGFLGFPIRSGWAVAVGVSPYSSVGYQLQSNFSVNGVSSTLQTEGNGGLNKFFLSSGYQIYNELSIGASFEYNFGRIQFNSLQNIEGVQFTMQEYNESLLRGVSFNIGVYYQRKLNHKLKLSTSLTYSPESKLTSQNTRTISTLEYGTTTTAISGVQTVDLSAMNLATTNLILPAKWNIGIGIGQQKKWFVGVDYTNKETKNFSNPFLSVTNVHYENGYELSLGGFYLPQYYSFSSYWKRVVYRMGMRYEKMGILVNNQSIDDFGISFGASFPVKGFSSTTLVFEYGKRGTLSQNLVKENYFNLRIGFTLNDKWFQKTKYQ